MNPDLDLKRVFRTTVIISGTLVATLFAYALIVELIKSQLAPFPGLFDSGIRRQTLRYLSFGAAAGSVIFVRFAGLALHKPTPGEDPRHLLLRLSRTAVITSALGELPALLGLMLFFLTGFSRDFYVLLFVSLFLEFMYFPRLRVWQDLIRDNLSQRGT